MNDDLQNTMRGQQNCHSGVLSGGYQKGIANHNYEAKSTLKKYCEGYTGGVRGNQQSSSRHFEVSNTQRGNCNQELGGPAGSYLKSSGQYQHIYSEYEQNPQMGRELVSNSFVPGPSRMNINLDAKEMINDVNIEKQSQNNEYVPVSTIRNQNNFSTVNNVGIVNIPQKLPQANQRLQLSIAQDQLKSNELHVSII